MPNHLIDIFTPDGTSGYTRFTAWHWIVRRGGGRENGRPKVRGGQAIEKRDRRFEETLERQGAGMTRLRGEEEKPKRNCEHRGTGSWGRCMRLGSCFNPLFLYITEMKALRKPATHRG